MINNYTVAPRGIACEHFPDETIVLNLPKGNYYSLKETGQFIWSLLEKKAPSNHIAQQLSDYYTITTEEAHLSLETFLNQLAQEELIIEADYTTTDGLPVAESTTTNQAFTTPVLEVYTDMQELLMLDPIHDADPDKGWPHKSN